MDILLADDQARVRYALRILLEQQPAWRVIGEASDACELLDRAQGCHPDLVLLDGDLPGIHEADAYQSIRQACADACIVALVEPQPAAHTKNHLKADAYVTRVNSPQFLLAVIRKCLERRPCR